MQRLPGKSYNRRAGSSPRRPALLHSTARMPDTSFSTRVSVRVVYLARLRDAFGSAGETLVLDDNHARTVDSIVRALRDRGGAWAHELAPDRAVRFAVNHRLAQRPQAVAAGDEVAIFPPVIGG